MATIVVNCSKRKRVAPSLSARELGRGTLEELSRQWNERVASATKLTKADDLYGGRQFREASRARELLAGQLLIVSAGLGVLRPSDQIPSYGLTVAAGQADNILLRVDGNGTPTEWWQALTGAGGRFHSLRTMMRQADTAGEPLLIALPSPYLTMIEPEIEELAPERLSRTRVFTGQSFRFRDDRLNRYLMPYDARLDGPDSPSPGTATDFSSRALRDFAAFILPGAPDATPEEHAAAVLRRLGKWSSAARPERKRQSDADLLEIIRTHWSQAGGSASQMLRWVRGELGIACEQGRMRHLYAAVHNEMEIAA
jgi:hypothetical protein